MRAAPVLLLLTFRPVYEPPWHDRPHVTRLTVTPLTPAQTAAMVEGIAKGALPAEVVGQVVTQSDGVPLFVEELTKSVLESMRLASAEPGRGTKLQPSALAIPSTLQDSLMARLDRLGPTKEVAQVAAVLGREFPHALLAAAMAEDPSLEPGLERLVSAELLYPRGDPPSSYTFKHALIQEAAYESLLKGTRRAWHARIAQILEESFPALVASEPEAVARHCEEGALVEKAISYYQRAGERATARSASAEAVGHLRRAIALLSTLPESPERDRWELVLQVALGTPLVSSASWAHPEAEHTHARARELCERVPDAPQLFQVIRNLVSFYIGRDELETASELSARLLRLAERDGESSHLLLAHQHAAIVRYFLGRPADALEHHEQAVALYNPEQHRVLTPVYGFELGVFTRINTAWTLWILGHPDRALAASSEAIELGVRSGHAYSLAYAFLWGAVVNVMRREPEAIRERSEAALEIGKEQGFSFIQGGARLVRAVGRLMSRLGARDIGEEIEEYRQSIAQLAGTGTVSNQPEILGYLAEAYCVEGRYEEAHKVIEGALATSQRYWDAELYRLQGELLRHEGAEGDAERLLRRSLLVARNQKARSFELRASTSLGRLWRKQGKQEEARKLLEPIYGWFTEGFQTPDLREARALLEALA